MRKTFRAGMLTRPSGKTDFKFRPRTNPHTHDLEPITDVYGEDGYECDCLVHKGDNTNLRGMSWHCKGCGQYDLCPECMLTGEK